jgi:hypothetical protein
MRSKRAARAGLKMVFICVLIVVVRLIKWNRRSLHYATPDFLSNLLALIYFIRLSLRKTAPVVLYTPA